MPKLGSAQEQVFGKVIPRFRERQEGERVHNVGSRDTDSAGLYSSIQAIVVVCPIYVGHLGEEEQKICSWVEIDDPRLHDEFLSSIF